MTNHVAKVAIRTARKNPGAALTVAAYTARHWDEFAKSLGVSGRTPQAVVRAGEPRVQKELRAAVASLSGAVARARVIGIRNVPGDKRLAKQVEAAANHTSQALTTIRGGRKTHRLRNLGAVGLGLAGAAYALWHRGERDSQA